MLKKFTNKKGFTLMEMLIVVAIIAVLIAIAIPTFNSALNKAKVGTDTANIRSGYAGVMVEILAGGAAKDDTYGLNDDGSVTKLTSGATGSYTTKGKAEADVTIGGVSVTAWESGKHVAYTVGDDGKVKTIAVS